MTMENVTPNGFRMLEENDREAIMRFVCDEAAYNLFIIGDVENYGLNDEHVNVAVHEKDGGWDSLVLRYHESFVVYTKREDYNAQAVADYIKGYAFEIISGKGSVVEKLIPYFSKSKPRVTLLAQCDALTQNEMIPQDAVIRRMQPFEMDKVVALYCTVDEFRYQYIGNENKRAVRMARELQKGGMGFGAFVGGELVSYAQITARSSMGAVVVGVATHPDYRRRGLASAVMRTLCKASFEDGLSFLSLFYDNPQAGRIYRRLGFVELGEYMMLSSVMEETD